MESLPEGWTLHTCDQGGDRSGLLGGPDPDISAVTHVWDLFHEDAQVGIGLFGNKEGYNLALELFYAEYGHCPLMSGPRVLCCLV